MKVTQNFLLFENCLQQQQNEVFNQVLLKLRPKLSLCQRINQYQSIIILLYTMYE